MPHMQDLDAAKQLKILISFVFPRGDLDYAALIDEKWRSNNILNTIRDCSITSEDYLVELWVSR